MQSCLCLSRLGKPLLHTSHYPWRLCYGGAHALPNLSPKDVRFFHVGQSKLRDDPQKGVQTVRPGISRSNHEAQFISAPPRATAIPQRPYETHCLPLPRYHHLRRQRQRQRHRLRVGVPIRTVLAYRKQEKDHIWEGQQSRAAHNPQANESDNTPRDTSSHMIDVPLQSLPSLVLAVAPGTNAPPQTFFASLKRVGKNFEDSELYQWSPGVALAKILGMRDEGERENFWLDLRQRRSSRSLPIITIHFLLRSRLPRAKWTQHDETVHRKAQDVLDSRGMTWDDVSNWAWILSGRTPDEMAHRLVSTPTDLPLFILLEILRRDISKIKSLEMLLDYSRDRILNLNGPPRSSGPESQPSPSEDIEETSKPDVSTTSWEDRHGTTAKLEHIRIQENAFTILVSRLLYQSRRIAPSAMVDVARMAAGYLHSISASNGGNSESLDSRFFARLCKMNNYFLRLLALPSSLQPLQSMAYNWSAQKILLELAGQFEPPLRLDHASYRAVIQVLAASKKSARETRSVTFRNRSWPPWRVEQDGMDAQRAQDEDLSRVISAITRSKESGYTQDSQLSIFGGLDTDGTPTIHTRKLFKWRALDSFTQAKASSRDEARLWAARVEATRDVHEAWGAFTEFRRKGGKANMPMYFAMFQKLNYDSRRSGIESEIHATPGDGREVFPVSDNNFSDFYRLRLRPPALQDLYQEMRAAGIRPSGRCLNFLLRHARTIDEGFQYLLDSGWDKQVITYLSNGGSQMVVHAKYQPMRQVLADVVSQVSDQMLTGFMSLICRFAPRVVKTCSVSEPGVVEPLRKRGSSPIHSPAWTVCETGVQKTHHHRLRNPLHHTAFLLKSWQPRFRPAWYVLFKCLARRDIVLVRHFAEDPERMCENHEQAWRVARAALEGFHDCDLELDPEGFLLLCQTFAKYAEAAFHKSKRHQIVLVETSRVVKAEYVKLTDGGKEASNRISRLWHTLEGVHLHGYVRAMGLIGDHAAIISLLEWMVSNHEELDVISLQSANGQRMLRQTIVAAKVFCDGTDNAAATARSLVEQVESWGGWPGEEDVNDYLDRGKNQIESTGTFEDGEEDDGGEEGVEAQVADGGSN